ncbi:MAG TPA: dipeptidase [Atribacteraceae bacterium]|nr:dipeptidase [Atribacteraceae bacterium]
MKTQETHQYIEQHRQRIHSELCGFLRIPSISAGSSFQSAIGQAASWLAGQTEQLGFQTSVDETNGHPVVFAHRIDHPDRPVILIYGHYDVQPPDPLEEWSSAPFSPEMRDGFVYARGSNDDKGQFFTALKAIEAILSVQSSLPINLILVVEGEEEIGSPHFESWLSKRSRDFTAEAIVILDGQQYERGIPTLSYGLRGLCYVQVDITGPRFDLHSGVYGGGVANPLNVLASLLDRLKNADGHIAIPHFYDQVREPEPWEREELASLPFNEQRMLEYLGVNALTPEKGYTAQECMLLRPTLDVCGIWGGYAGEGAKTIIPARGGAKVSMRLVPEQDPSSITHFLSDYLHSIAPPGVELTLTEFSGIEPIVVSRDSKIFRTMHHSLKRHFGRSPVYVRLGGSVGVATMFKRHLSCENILIIGWGSPDDQVHSPNERLNLADFERGIHTLIDCILEYPVLQ